MHVADVALRWRGVTDHRDSIVAKLFQGMEDALRLARVERVAGRGGLLGGGGVAVNDAQGGVRTISAAQILVATGSRSRSLPFLPVDGKRIITSDEALDREPPKRAIIVGAGAVE